MGELLKISKIMYALLALVAMATCLPSSAFAVGEYAEQTVAIVRASGKFSMDIPANSTVKATTSFPLETGETVEINAVYSPQFASVDIGLLDPEGWFHPINTTDGSFDKTIRVNERGNYTLVIRNNASCPISISGYVTY